MVNPDKTQFWNTRAITSANPGTDDYNIKNLEEKIIVEIIPKNVRILDIGCGNGSTLIRLALEKDCSGVGIDFSDKMIELAITSSEQLKLQNKVNFFIDSIPDLKQKYGLFDYIVSERCLINLESSSLQHQAFVELMSYLKPGGFFLMIESFTDGLEKINALRNHLNLEPIGAPWHNHFLSEKIVKSWQTNQYHIDREHHFSSAYYYISRVVYAKLAHNRGEDVTYDSEINQIACQLPPFGEFGPTRLYLWKNKTP